MKSSVQYLQDAVDLFDEGMNARSQGNADLAVACGNLGQLAMSLGMLTANMAIPTREEIPDPDDGEPAPG